MFQSFTLNLLQSFILLFKHASCLHDLLLDLLSSLPLLIELHRKLFDSLIPFFHSLNKLTIVFLHPVKPLLDIFPFYLSSLQQLSLLICLLLPNLPELPLVLLGQFALGFLDSSGYVGIIQFFDSSDSIMMMLLPLFKFIGEFLFKPIPQLLHRFL